MPESITYYGLDLGDYYSQLSFFRDDMTEPISISTIVGSKRYLIPTVIGKKPGGMQWYIGEEATGMQIKAEGLLSKAIKRECVDMEGEFVPATELLAIYIRRVLQMSGTILPHREDDLYVICIDHASQLAVETLIEITGNIGINRERVKICSRQECFCYFMMNQDGALRIHDVILLDYWKNHFKVYQLSQDRSFEPMVVSVKERQISKMEEIGLKQQGMTPEELRSCKDQSLYESLSEIMGDEIISSMYLVGDGFDGDWMNRSLSRMCAGRRVFGGKNLYTKGACYYAKVSYHGTNQTPEYLYLGGGNLLANVCIKGRTQQEYSYKVLIPAGYNWQDAHGEVELLIRKKPKEEEAVALEFLIRSLKGQERKERIELTGLKLQGDMPTRVRVSGQAVSTSKVKFQVEDLGFGQLRQVEGKTWDFEFRI